MLRRLVVHCTWSTKLVHCNAAQYTQSQPDLAPWAFKVTANFCIRACLLGNSSLSVGAHQPSIMLRIMAMVCMVNGSPLVFSSLALTCTKGRGKGRCSLLPSTGRQGRRSCARLPLDAAMMAVNTVRSCEKAPCARGKQMAALRSRRTGSSGHGGDAPRPPPTGAGSWRPPR